jgi:hypothetical protein
MRYGKNNPHPRGLIGEIVANFLQDRGWSEEEIEGYPSGAWVKGDIVASMEQAYEREINDTGNL